MIMMMMAAINIIFEPFLFVEPVLDTCEIYYI